MGYIVMLNGAAVSWQLPWQQVTALVLLKQSTLLPMWGGQMWFIYSCCYKSSGTNTGSCCMGRQHGMYLHVMYLCCACQDTAPSKLWTTACVRWSRMEHSLTAPGQGCSWRPSQLLVLVSKGNAKAQLREALLHHASKHHDRDGSDLVSLLGSVEPQPLCVVAWAVHAVVLT